jgi:hypothetical protein
MIPLLEPRGRALRTAVLSLAPAAREDSDTSDPLGTLPAHGGLIRTGTADLTGLAVLRGKGPGKPGRLMGV